MFTGGDLQLIGGGDQASDQHLSGRLQLQI